MKGENMKYLLFILLLVVVVITAGCVGGTPTNITPTSTPTPNDTIAIITQQSQGTNTSTQKNSSTQNDCTPPILKIGFKEDQFVKQDSSHCVGIGAPVFTVPEYPAGPIVNDSVVGKFYWWSKLGYCEFRDDGIWILYAWDNQPHYYPGTWGKSEKLYGNGQIYYVQIVRPNAMGSSNYTESLSLNYNPEKDRLYLISYDGIRYSEFTDAWVGRLR